MKVLAICQSYTVSFNHVEHRNVTEQNIGRPVAKQISTVTPIHADEDDDVMTFKKTL